MSSPNPAPAQSSSNDHSNPAAISSNHSRSSPGPQTSQLTEHRQQSHPQSDPPAPTSPPPNPRLQSLQAKQTSLQETLSNLQTQRTALITTYTAANSTGVTNPDPQPTDPTTTALAAAKARIQSHIALLHAYNEIKDIGQGLMGMVSEQRGVRVREVMGEFGVGEGD